MFLADIPSPSRGAWDLGPIPIRAYALCILLGIVAACAITEYRMRQRGAPHWLVLDIAVWAVPFGIIGARLYHVITSPDDYFGADGNPVAVFKIWEGGLGIWGAVAGGAVGAWLACRQMGIPLTFVADALAPGLPVAQAIGRVGNWFNNELYGSHTSLPWGLKVHEYDLSKGVAVDQNGDGSTILPGGPFHPAFLYEALWDIGVAVLVWMMDRRYKFGRGRAFALYVMAYTVGRFWIEALRTDPAGHFLGMRTNNWVSILVFLGALAYFLRVRGPQEHLMQHENGRLYVVDAAGEPIPGLGRDLQADVAAAEAEEAAEAGEDEESDEAEDVKAGSDAPARAGPEADEGGDSGPPPPEASAAKPDAEPDADPDVIGSDAEPAEKGK